MDISNGNYTLISINTVLPIAWETKLIVSNQGPNGSGIKILKTYQNKLNSIVDILYNIHILSINSFPFCYILWLQFNL